MAQIVRLEVGYECFSSFVRRMRIKYGQGWSYIAVPEFQTRGAVHFHVLAWGLSQNLVEDERDTRTIQRLWSYGTCDLIKTDGSSGLAGYMAKYMQKALFDERLLQQKAYVCSRNIMRPMSYSLSSIADYADLIFGEKTLVDRREFLTQWLGACVKSTYILDNK
ncbi:MAG: hypothetical protein V4664_01235 [Patescibacteria group bacterium]